jgi:hypothetical protein
MQCSSPEGAEEAATRLATDLKLGKPCYRMRTDQRFLYWFDLPRHTAFFGEGIDVESLGHPLQLFYEEDAALDASVLALRALTLFDEASPRDASIDLTVQAPGEGRANLNRKTWSDDGARPFEADRAFCLIEFPPAEAARIASSLLSEASFEVLRANARVSLGIGLEDYSRRPYADVVERLRQGDCTRMIIQGEWSAVGPSCVAILRSFVRDRRLEEARIRIGTHASSMDARVAEREQTLGLPKYVVIHSFYPSKKWSPFLAPPGVEKGKPVRFQLYARDVGGFRIQLDIVHRASAEPLLDFQVVDESGKRRAAKELAKRLAGQSGWRVWTGDHWERANA